MSGYEIDPVAKRIEFTRGPRIVSSNRGTLLNFLPIGDGFSDTINMVFPDVPKDYLSVWDWTSDYNNLASLYGWSSHGISITTTTPQEWTDTTILDAAPPGADIFASKIRFTRTINPSHNWGGQAIDILPEENEWIPFNGSALLEVEFNMSRAFSLYIESGNLILHQQQSIGTPPGGYGTQPGGVTPPTFGADKSGGEVVYGSAAGMPIWAGSGSPYEKSTSGTKSGTLAPTSQCRTHRISGSDPCSTADPTDYGVTYDLEIFGQYGRRS